MTIAELLRKFLGEQPAAEAAVPGLGVFYAAEQQGKKGIGFKEEAPVSKAFLNYIAFEESISFEQAYAAAEAWVRTLLEGLKTTGTADVEGVGTFSVEGGRVVFVPVWNATETDDKFGLDNTPVGETPVAEPPVAGAPVSAAPAQQPAQQPVQQSAPQQRPLRPQRAPQQTRPQTARPQQPMRGRGGVIIERPKPKNPNAAGDITLDNRRRQNGARMAGQKNETAFYAKWWFILICLLAVIVAVCLAVKPIRVNVLGIGAEQRPVVMEPLNDEELGENVDKFTKEDEEETAAVVNAIVKDMEENAKPEVKPEPQPAPKSQPAPKPEPKPLAQTKPVKPTAQPAPKAEEPVQNADASVARPQAGKLYMIVGGFVYKEGAERAVSEWKEKGYRPVLLYVEKAQKYYVSLKTCQSREDAVAARTELTGKGISCWIFTN